MEFQAGEACGVGELEVYGRDNLPERHLMCWTGDYRRDVVEKIDFLANDLGATDLWLDYVETAFSQGNENAGLDRLVDTGLLEILRKRGIRYWLSEHEAFTHMVNSPEDLRDDRRWYTLFRQMKQIFSPARDLGFRGIVGGAGPLELARPAIASLEHVRGCGGRFPLRVHVEQVHEGIMGQRLWPLGEDAVFGPPEVCLQDTHAANENRHLRGGQRQEMRPIHQQLLGRSVVSVFEVVAEPVRGRFEHGKGVHVGLLLRRVRSPRREGNFQVVSGVLRSRLDGRGSASKSAHRWGPP